MAIDRKLLEILCCPVSKQPLQVLNQDKLGRLNAAITAGEVHFLNGERVETALDEALITQSGTTIYQIKDGIPVMLEDESIATEQLENF